MSVTMQALPATRDALFKYAQSRYGTQPEYPWRPLPRYAVLRHPNGKWYALFMDVENRKLGLSGCGKTDILVVKCPQVLRCALLGQAGFLPAYHMNRERWITALLDGSAPEEAVLQLLNASYQMTQAPARRERVGRGRISWIVPVNTRYFDIERAFTEKEELLWKQSSHVCIGDTAYLYLTAPDSAIRYECAVTEVDIPYAYDDGNIRMHRVMRLQRVRRFHTPIPLSKLKEHGVFTVRGPVKMPYGLKREIEETVRQADDGATGGQEK